MHLLAAIHKIGESGVRNEKRDRLRELLMVAAIEEADILAKMMILVNWRKHYLYDFALILDCSEDIYLKYGLH